MIDMEGHYIILFFATQIDRFWLTAHCQVEKCLTY